MVNVFISTLATFSLGTLGGWVLRGAYQYCFPRAEPALRRRPDATRQLLH